MDFICKGYIKRSSGDLGWKGLQKITESSTKVFCKEEFLVSQRTLWLYNKLNREVVSCDCRPKRTAWWLCFVLSNTLRWALLPAEICASETKNAVRSSPSFRVVLSYTPFRTFIHGVTLCCVDNHNSGQQERVWVSDWVTLAESALCINCARLLTPSSCGHGRRSSWAVSVTALPAASVAHPLYSFTGLESPWVLTVVLLEHCVYPSPPTRFRPGLMILITAQRYTEWLLFEKLTTKWS